MVKEAEAKKVVLKREDEPVKANEKEVVVTFPNGEILTFVAEKNAKGQDLLDAVSEAISLAEKEYFALQFLDQIGGKNYLRLDKKISNQLKKQQWAFEFSVKFFVPDPSVLVDDRSRDLYYQEIRREIYNENLSTTYPTKVLLAAIAMQIHSGDFEKSQNDAEGYDSFVKNCHLVRDIDNDFISKVREAHKEQKGLTSEEACLKFLDAAKKLPKYGVHFFDAKDSKNSPVKVGVSAHGIVVLKDEVRIHRFLWQSIEKFSYRENKFTVIVKPGELDDKKAVSVSFKCADFHNAKRLYETAVEHHIFFRLIRSDSPSKDRLKWGRGKFGYFGRTYFQTKMASQMFEASHPVSSGRQVSRSVDDMVPQQEIPTSPLNFADETTQQASSPEKSKSSMTKAEKAKQKADELMRQNTSESNASKSSAESLIQPLSSEYVVRPYSPRDPALTSPYEDFPLGLSAEERKKIYTTPQKTRLPKVQFAQDGSAVAIAPAVKPGKRVVRRRLFGPVNDDHTHFHPVDDLILSPEVVTVSINDLVSTYHKGFYDEKVPLETGHEFSLICCKPTKSNIGEKILRNKNPYPEREFVLEKKLETERFPIRYFVDVYHSGYSQMKNRPKKRLFNKDEDVVEKNQLKKQYYEFSSEPQYDFERLEANQDLEVLPLKQYSNVYWFGGNSRPGKAKSTYEIPIEQLQGKEKAVCQTAEVVGSAPLVMVEEKVISQVTITTTLVEKTNEETPQTTQEVDANLAKIEEMDAVPLKKFVSVYHSGQSLEHVSPIQWVKRQKALLMKSRTSEDSSSPSTSSESVTKLKLGKRKQRSSLSDDYPTIAEPFKGELSEIRKQPDLPLFNLFDHVSFRPKEEAKADVEPLAKKAKYNRRGQLCLWCGPGTKMANTDEYPADDVVYTGKVDDIKKTEEMAEIELEKCVAFPSEFIEEKEMAQKQPQQHVSVQDNFEEEAFVPREFEEKQKAGVSEHVKQLKVDVQEASGAQERRKRRSKEIMSKEMFKKAVVEDLPDDDSQNQPEEQKQVVVLHKEREALSCDVFESGSTDKADVIQQQDVSSTNEPKQLATKKTGKLSYKSKQDKENKLENAPTAKPSENVRKRLVSTYSISKHYPEPEEKYQGKLYSLSPADQIKTGNLFDWIDFGTENDNKENVKTSRTWDLWCASKSKRKASTEDTFIDINDKNRGARSKNDGMRQRLVSTYSLSKNYPEMTPPFEGELSTLSPQEEIKCSNLFDEIEFLIDDETEKFGPPAWKFWRRFMVTKQTEIKPEEKQVEDLTKAAVSTKRRSSTYSMSQHYPEVSPKYEGELLALSPAQNVPEANLFDIIDFAHSQIVDETSKSRNKNWKLWCISKDQEKEESALVQEKKEERKPSVRERIVSMYSMSEYYPEISEPFEGELIELSPEKEIPTSILFDEIDFLIDDETKKFGVPPTWKFWHKSSKTEVDSKEIKVKPQKKAFAKVDRKRLESTYSMSQHYPEISPKYEGELLALSPAQNVPEANLFDIIDFVPDWIKEDDDNEKTLKGWNLWCVPKADSTSTENAEEIPSKNLVERQRKTEQKRERLVSTFSMSKYYPEPEEKYEGELFEIRPATQIPESKLFDEISFLTEDDEETARKHKLSKNWNLCIPLSKEMKAEKSAVTAQEVSPKSETARSAQRPQSPIGQFSFKKTVWTAKSKPSSLEGYPTITTPFSGKINELSKSFELENSDLFESVTFLPKTERIETDIPKTEVQIKKKKLKLFAKKRLSKFGSAMDLSAYPKSLAYDGPLENLGKSDEIGGTPLKIEVVKYHSGYSIPFGKSKFERCRFDAVEETGEAAGDYPGIDFDPASAVPIYPVEHETIAMRSFCPRPVMDKMPQARTPKDARRRTSSKHYESDSDTSSQETEPSDLVQFSKSESFLKFIRNRLNTKNTTKKKTGFENLVEPFSAECPEIRKHEDVGNYPILDHVHVYHNGQSTQQAIDSGFEEAGSADEHKKVANLYLKKSAKPSFLSKFKLSREFNEKTVDDAPEQTELDSSPFLGLYSTVPLQPDVEHVPLISVVTNLPTVTYYDKRSLASPVPTESDETEQKPPAEPKVETKKAKKSKDLHDLYGLSWEKYEGPVFDIGRSKREVEDWPVGEYATVYHCGRSDLPVAEIPDEFYQIPIETDLDMKKSAILHVKTSNESAEQFIENLEAHKHEPEESEGLKVHVNVFRSEVQEPSTSETAKRLSFSERLAVVFKKPKKNYPTIGESFDGEPAEIEPSSDFENQKQQQFVQPEHSQVSKQRKQRKRKLKVNLNDYPFDPEPIDENVSDLMITKDLPRIPAPFSVGSGAIVEKPRRRFRFRRFWRRRRAGEPFAISGINKRDDVSSTLFSTVITDRSLFVAGHWPVTDIDVDVALKRVAQIDCECEANVVLGKSYFDAIGGGKSFGPQGSSSIVQTNRGTNHAKASVLIREKAEPVETARRAAEDCYLDSTLPSDFVQLEDDDDEMRENYLRGLSPSTWRRKFREGGLCRSGSRSPTDSMAHSTTAVSPTNTGGMFASIKRRFSEKLAKKDQKEKEKQRKKQEKEAKKKVKKGEVGYDVETESSSPISDAEIEERHLFISKAVEGPEESLKKARELNSAVDEEGSAPFSTVHTWHETEAGPEQVYTQIDKYGNKITKTVKTQTTKHTIQKQTYQTYAVDGNQPESITKTEETFTPINNDSVTRANVVNTHTRTIAYEKGSEPDRGNEPLGELVSSKTITSGNRTVEILTFKTEKDGVVETRVEHRVTIHSGEDIDHDAELAKALLEATKLSPDMYITQIEMDSSTQN